MNVSLYELAQLVQGTVIGNHEHCVSALAPIDAIQPGTLVLADSVDNVKKAENSAATALLVGTSIKESSKPLIQVSHPFKAFIALLEFFHPEKKISPGIHPSAIIAPDAKIGQSVFIGPYVVIEAGSSIGNNVVLRAHVFIGQNVRIGDDSVIHPHVTVYNNSEIGARVQIHASTVVGSDGFGYKLIDNERLKLPHVGHVRIEDDVEIGANSAIDRATLGATVIGKGSKIDNFVQIAHSVRLGKNNILCAFTGIAGSTHSGDNVIFAANVGVSDHVTIDDDVILTARAGVPPHKQLIKGNIYLGNPARPREKAIEQELAVTRIPAMRKHLKALREQVRKISQHLKIDEPELS